MNPMSNSGADAVSSIVSLAVFIILFVVIYGSLDAVRLPAASRFTLALCATILAVIGMSEFMTGSGRPSHPAPAPVAPHPARRNHDWILAPYAAMGLSILFVVCLVALERVTRRLRQFMHRKPREIPRPELPPMAPRPPSPPAKAPQVWQFVELEPRPWTNEAHIAAHLRAPTVAPQARIAKKANLNLSLKKTDRDQVTGALRESK